MNAVRRTTPQLRTQHAPKPAAPSPSRVLARIPFVGAPCDDLAKSEQCTTADAMNQPADEQLESGPSKTSERLTSIRTMLSPSTQSAFDWMRWKLSVLPASWGLILVGGLMGLMAAIILMNRETPVDDHQHSDVIIEDVSPPPLWTPQTVQTAPATTHQPMSANVAPQVAEQYQPNYPAPMPSARTYAVEGVPHSPNPATEVSPLVADRRGTLLDGARVESNRPPQGASNGEWRQPPAVAPWNDRSQIDAVHRIPEIDPRSSDSSPMPVDGGGAFEPSTENRGTPQVRRNRFVDDESMHSAAGDPYPPRNDMRGAAPDFRNEPYRNALNRAEPYTSYPPVDSRSGQRPQSQDNRSADGRGDQGYDSQLNGPVRGQMPESGRYR